MAIEILKMKPVVISRRKPLVLQQIVLQKTHDLKKGSVNHRDIYFKDVDEYLCFLSKMIGKNHLVYDHVPREFHEQAIENGLPFGVINLPKRTSEGNLVSVTVFDGSQNEVYEHFLPKIKSKKQKNARQ